MIINFFVDNDKDYQLILNDQGLSNDSHCSDHFDDPYPPLMMVWWLLVVIGWKHWVMDHDGVGSRPRVMEQVLTMNVIPYNESHKTDLPSASFVRSPNCRDGTFVAE